jgi:hypothetical protein
MQVFTGTQGHKNNKHSSTTRNLVRATAFIVIFMVLVTQLQAQTNCPSGINLNVNSADPMISIWSPLSNGDYRLTRAWNIGTHTGRDIYSLDLSMAGTSDLGKAVFLPITARVWAASTSGPYGNTAMIWDPGSGIVVRLAHMLSFSSIANGSMGTWYGAGVKVGYIGETGCPGCGPHLHVSTYRNVKIGIAFSGHSVTEQEITGYLSKGLTPAFAQAQKFRLIAPSDNCELIRFDDNSTIYTKKNGQLYPVTFDVWRSWGLSLNLNQVEGQFDQTAGRIPINVLPAYQRSWYSISSNLTPPRTDSVFRGFQYPDTYVYRWGQKNPLSANQFGDQAWYEYRWSEVQYMDQGFVDKINPRTYR